MRTYKKIEPEEFVERIEEGEKDFTGTNLEGADLSDYVRRLNSYLKDETRNLKKHPIDISYANLKRVKAPGLYCPYIKGVEADLSETDLSEADLFGANFKEANFSGAELPYSDLKGAKLSYADFYFTDFTGADLSYANFTGAKLIGTYFVRADLVGANFFGANISEANFNEANLRRADFRLVDGIEESRGLGSANLYRTIVTPRERELFVEKISLELENPSIPKEVLRKEVSQALDRLLIVKHFGFAPLELDF